MISCPHSRTTWFLGQGCPITQHQGAPFTSKSMSVVAFGVTTVVLHGALFPKTGYYDRLVAYSTPASRRAAYVSRRKQRMGKYLESQNKPIIHLNISPQSEKKQKENSTPTLPMPSLCMWVKWGKRRQTEDSFNPQKKAFMCLQDTAVRSLLSSKETKNTNTCRSVHAPACAHTHTLTQEKLLI